MKFPPPSPRGHPLVPGDSPGQMVMSFGRLLVFFLCPFTNTSYAKATAKCAAASSLCSARFRQLPLRNVRPARNPFARSGQRSILRRQCRFQTLRRPGSPFSSARARESTKGSNANQGLSHLDKWLSRPLPQDFSGTFGLADCHIFNTGGAGPAAAALRKP